MTMCTDKRLSICFYKYLCKKIGSEEDVKARRLSYIIDDIGTDLGSSNKITSGSKGEGLNLKGSDLDIMLIDPEFQVYESEAVPNFERISLVIDTEDTHPCFTQLRLFNTNLIPLDLEERINTMFLGDRLSSELYKLQYMHVDLSEFPSSLLFKTIHGPCISSWDGCYDFAHCLKCDQWISQARGWIIRSRTAWPPPELISKIISCGVLFVPIGFKGSTNENIQWRMSFSVAEKILIFSFSHTQLLCYALLKILVKEIVEKHENMKEFKGLLCSYFLKTLLFWVSEESHRHVWRPHNIIPCFMACLRRLLYCVEYSTLLHYFIPDNNLFYLRFNTETKENLIFILKQSYDHGIHCFIHSKTLGAFLRTSCESTNSPLITCITPLHSVITVPILLSSNSFSLLYNLLHHARTDLSKAFFIVLFSNGHQSFPSLLQNKNASNNKLKYYKYTFDLCILLLGIQSNAVSGWLLLASFYYTHKNYSTSLKIILYALSKCTDEKIYIWQDTLTQNQESLIKAMNQEKLYTIIRMMIINKVIFYAESSLIPLELHQDGKTDAIPHYPVPFAHFLRFLCYYHLNNITAGRSALHKLELEMINFDIKTSKHLSETQLLIITGIANHMLGNLNRAKFLFYLATKFDQFNVTSALVRLSVLICNENKTI